MLTLREHGAQRYRGVIAPHLDALSAALPQLARHQAGMRIRGTERLRAFLSERGAIGSIVADVLGPATRPVRAVLFDKSVTTNWALAWHQDRTICVRQRIDINGFGPWTIKAGVHHVAPPFDLLTRMVTVRVHLDDVPATNAPLLIAPGSHAEGRVPVGRTEEMVRFYGVERCLADAGDLWLYATLILHASEAAINPTHRRVLQVDYAAEDLPGGLVWLGV